MTYVTFTHVGTGISLTIPFQTRTWAVTMAGRAPEGWLTMIEV